MEFTYVFLIALIVLAVVFVKKSVIIIPQSETKIVERLGKYFATLKPGINIIITPIVTISTFTNDRSFAAVKIKTPTENEQTMLNIILFGNIDANLR